MLELAAPAEEKMEEGYAVEQEGRDPERLGQEMNTQESFHLPQLSQVWQPGCEWRLPVLLWKSSGKQRQEASPDGHIKRCHGIFKLTGVTLPSLLSV